MIDPYYQGVYEGGTILIACNTPRIVQWSHDQNAIAPSSQTRDKINYLRIENASHTDTGNYYCSSNDTDGEDFHYVSYVMVGGKNFYF